MNTVDEILETGRYTDRRGREWVKHTYLHGSVEWLHFVTGGTYASRPAEMRLLIERDQHRDECAGLYRCSIHPVPKVLAYAGPQFTASKARSLVERGYATLPEAMGAARASAVGA